MNLEYKIVAFDENTGQIWVQYRDLSPILIDLPIDENLNIPIGSELDSFIKNFLPVWHFERIDKLKQGLKQDQVAAIKSLVQPLPVVEEEITPLVENVLSTDVSSN